MTATTYYVYGLGLLGQEEADAQGNAVYRQYHFDARGSTVLLTDGSGAVTDAFSYGPYGEDFGRTGSTDTPFRFHGRFGVQTDPNGLLSMRARAYHPLLRRFLTRDALLGSFSPGVALSRYAFANGNPVSLVDPFGLCADGGFLAKLNRGLFDLVSALNPFNAGNAFQQTGDAMLRGMAAFSETVDQAPVWLSEQLGVGSGMTTSDMALALGPIGARFDEVLAGTRSLAALARASEGSGTTAASLDPLLVRFSQSLVNGTEEITASMRANGWQGPPVDVVRMGDGGLTAFGNTRVVAANRAGISVQAVVHDAGDAFPAGRWRTRGGTEPLTWGDAVQASIAQQNRAFRDAYPNGSPFTGSTQ